MDDETEGDENLIPAPYGQSSDRQASTSPKTNFDRFSSSSAASNKVHLVDHVE